MSEYIKKTDIANIICRLEPDPDFQKKEHKFWEDISNEIFSIQGYRDAQPDNEPLTLDELREMDGEPVWVEEPNLWYGGNGVVSLAKGGVINPDDPNGCWPFENYGEWLACRSKPKEEHSETD